MNKHKHREDDEVQAGERFRETLRRVFTHQDEVRSGEVPFRIRNIRRVRIAFWHPARLPGFAESA